jgi:hypothetical protein
MIQSNMITIQEGRRLLDYPDLGQIETLANAAEERIYQYLDEIVEHGKYEGPDPFMNLGKAQEIVVQYINLYACCKLEDSKMGQLRQFFTQIQDLNMAAQPPPQPGAVGASPVAPQPANGLAAPQPLPQTELMPQTQAA